MHRDDVPHRASLGPVLGRRSVFALLGVLVSTLSGCMALNLSARGAPDAEMQTLELALRPVDLPAQHADHEMGHQPTPLWVTLPQSGWLHAWEYQLVDADGQPVDRGVLHHFKVMSPEHRELFSPIMLHLIGAGEETDPVVLPRQVGYRFEQGDSLLVTAMLHNPTDRDLRGVRLELQLHYSTRGDWQPPMDVVPFFAHVAPPMTVASYDLPPGRSERRASSSHPPFQAACSVSARTSIATVCR